MAKPGGLQYKDIPLKMVGSTKFGRFPKMSTEQTYNMMISDQWLVPFGGYSVQDTVSNTGEGRGILSSSKLSKMFTVIDNDVYSYDTSLSRAYLGAMTSYSGDVFLSEDNGGHVVFSDQQNLYSFDTNTNSFTNAAIGFSPGYITFQNDRFITPELGTNRFRLSTPNGVVFPNDTQFVSSLRTKSDVCVACVRFPGKGNLLLVFGKTVTELWQDVGAQLFPYQRNQSVNIDYGCINPATIAANENIVVWVAQNEQSGPAIMYTTGSDFRRISTDGIDYLLASLQFPANCYGFMLRLDGHLFYFVTWPQDNLSYAYDFNTKSFFTMTDENMQAYIAKRVAFFDEDYYFVSIRDGNLYQLSGNKFTYDYGDLGVHEIPFIRIPPSIQMDDQSIFITGYMGFTMEQGQFNYTTGQTNNIPRVDACLSKDGGVNFGSNVAKVCRPEGQRQNRLMWRNLGYSNNLTPQFRFHGFNRFVASDGILGIYQ